MKKHEATREQWKARLSNYRASGLTMSAWCAANQCTVDQLKYWLYKAKNKSASSEKIPGEFIPLSIMDPESAPDGAQPLHLFVGSTRIELRPGFDPELLRQAVRALC